ncbi:MAG: hypothetical protein J6K43_05845 [Lachnospiraceae bacterium]|nr:hypothetical protein [Lachnospiraceae bacterium]
MLRISDHICNELQNAKIFIKKLELNDRKEILDLIQKKYINSNKKGKWLWENFFQYEALNDAMSWCYIKDFVKDNECIMFFNQDEEKEMFLIKSGNDLNFILSETYGFEFYVTDKQGSYLLCLNHHNILYGCGKAKGWISNLRSTLELR